MNDESVAQSGTLNGGFHHSATKEDQKECDISWVVPFSLFCTLLHILESLGSFSLSCIHRHYLHIARPHQRALCSELPIQDGSLKMVLQEQACPGNSSLPMRWQHHLAGSFYLAPQQLLPHPCLWLPQLLGLPIARTPLTPPRICLQLPL